MNLNLKYRPRKFKDVCEQGIVTQILSRVVETQTFKNVYLFAGKSGCGKTTIARIFANAINKGIGAPREIDAASNNGVDNVRSIIEQASTRDLEAEYKIFIIDECHAITSAGWQAFLKGLEETPKYTIFIFCTTEPNKIPATVLNRMQRYNIAKISASGIKTRLEYICKQEGFTNYDKTIELIAKISDGCMRDAITYLDQCADFSTNLALENTKDILGDFSYETMFKLTWALSGQRGLGEKEVIETIEAVDASGKDLKHFIDMYINFMLDLAKFKLLGLIEATSIPAYLASESNGVVQFTVSFAGAADWFNKTLTTLLEMKNIIRYDTSYKSTVEIMMLKIARGN